MTVTHAVSLFFFRSSIFSLPLCIEILQSVLKITCLPGGNQEVVCRDLQPLVLCCSAAEVQYNKEAKSCIQTIAPSRNNKPHRQVFTHTHCYLKIYTKCMRRNQRWWKQCRWPRMCYPQYHIEPPSAANFYDIEQFYFKGHWKGLISEWYLSVWWLLSHANDEPMKEALLRKSATPPTCTNPDTDRRHSLVAAIISPEERAQMITALGLHALQDERKAADQAIDNSKEFRFLHG